MRRHPKRRAARPDRHDIVGHLDFSESGPGAPVQKRTNGHKRLVPARATRADGAERGKAADEALESQRRGAWRNRHGAQGVLVGLARLRPVPQSNTQLARIGLSVKDPEDEAADEAVPDAPRPRATGEASRPLQLLRPAETWRRRRGSRNCTSSSASRRPRCSPLTPGAALASRGGLPRSQGPGDAQSIRTPASAATKAPVVAALSARPSRARGGKDAPGGMNAGKDRSRSLALRGGAGPN